MTDKKIINHKKASDNTRSYKECCANIPPSSNEGISIEVDEYVAYFCGNDCYKKWKDRTDCCADNKNN